MHWIIIKTQRYIRLPVDDMTLVTILGKQPAVNGYKYSDHCSRYRLAGEEYRCQVFIIDSLACPILSRLKT
jgi:hypothetical protein